MHRSYNNFCLSVLFKISSFCTTKKQETGLERANFYFSFLCKWPFKLDFLHAVKQQGPKGLQNVIKPTSHWISPSIHTAVLFLWPVGKFNTVSLLWSILIYSLKCITLELVLLVDMSMRHGNEPRPQLKQGDRTRQEQHISLHASDAFMQHLFGYRRWATRSHPASCSAEQAQTFCVYTASCF